MTTGAVIVAAGMSSRMGTFKPMLQIGSISVVKRIVSTLQQSGAKLIVLVTGNKADILEQHLFNSGVVFVRNERYAETKMFDSAKLGFAYIQDKCDQVLFTPVDAPLFSAKTVRLLIDQKGEIVIPVCGENEGHPLLLRSAVISDLVKSDGSNGLRSALNATGRSIERVEVEDEGILYDMDTPSDYAKLIKCYNSHFSSV